MYLAGRALVVVPISAVSSQISPISRSAPSTVSSCVGTHTITMTNKGAKIRGFRGLRSDRTVWRRMCAACVSYLYSNHSECWCVSEIFTWAQFSVYNGFVIETAILTTKWKVNLNRKVFYERQLPTCGRTDESIEEW